MDNPFGGGQAPKHNKFKRKKKRLERVGNRKWKITWNLFEFI